MLVEPAATSALLAAENGWVTRTPAMKRHRASQSILLMLSKRISDEFSCRNFVSHNAKAERYAVE
jgi:hypothetical protein